MITGTPLTALLLALLPAIAIAQSRPADSAAIIAAPGYTVVPHGAGEIFDEGSELDEVKLTAIQTEGRYSVTDEVWHGGYAVPKHYHEAAVEAFYVISGEFEAKLGDDTRQFKAGDMIYIKPMMPHSFTVAAGKEAHILLVATPAGDPWPAIKEGAPAK